MNNRSISIFDPSRVFSDNFVKTFFDSPLMRNTDMEFELYEDENNVVLRAKLAGYKSNDFEISIEDNVLTLSASVDSETEQKDEKKKYYYKEIHQESFSRSFGLPVRVVSEQAKADYKDGILTIVMPKSEEVKPKRVEIQAS